MDTKKIYPVVLPTPLCALQSRRPLSLVTRAA
jgi:hypothetical protein